MTSEPLATTLQAAPAPALGASLELLASARRYRDWIFSLGAPHLGQRVLEIGSGTGTMTDCVASRDRVVALELEPECTAMLRARFAGVPSVEVVEGSATDPHLLRSLRSFGLDSAMSFNVLEHIPDDEGVMRAVHELLPRDGRFVCFVPAFPFLYGAFDHALGHVRRYTKRELSGRMERAGFDVVEMRYVNMVGAMLWFISGRVLRSSGVPGRERALRTYDRIAVPVSAALERRVRAPFGQSVMVVGRRV